MRIDDGFEEEGKEGVVTSSQNSKLSGREALKVGSQMNSLKAKDLNLKAQLYSTSQIEVQKRDLKELMGFYKEMGDDVEYKKACDQWLHLVKAGISKSVEPTVITLDSDTEENGAENSNAKRRRTTSSVLLPLVLNTSPRANSSNNRPSTTSSASSATASSVKTSSSRTQGNDFQDFLDSDFDADLNSAMESSIALCPEELTDEDLNGRHAIVSI